MTAGDVREPGEPLLQAKPHSSVHGVNIKDYAWDKVRDERFIAVRTDILRQYPFPEIKHTSFIPEGYIWLQLPGRMRWTNEVLRIRYTDQSDTLSLNRWKRSWRGLLYFYVWLLFHRPRIFMRNLGEKLWGH